MIFRPLAALIAVSACLPAAVLADPPPSGPKLTFTKDAVVVEELTPGAEVAFFGVTQTLAADQVPEMRAYARLLRDDNHDGVERLELPAGVPDHATFVAVDLDTGKAQAAAPSGYPIRRIPWRGRGITDSGHGVDQIEDNRVTANLLVCRRAVGCWFIETADGGAADVGQRADGTLRVLISSLEPLGNTTARPPGRLLPTDVVAMLDPRKLELTLVGVLPNE
ncbi:MAG TPA: hypothetical protein VGS57_21595 [Thermoanaerobaculia bacterium]|jgi:hypothetical protein|nr:hypothetical protein [Thermoanaerobaculia bacterium]